MIDLSLALKVFDRMYTKKAVAYICADRFCNDHMKKLIKKSYPKDEWKKYNVVQTLGYCTKKGCKQVGIVYYMEKK